MRFLLLLLLSLSLQAEGFWTLTGLQKANVYVKNELSIVKPETIATIKEKMAESLKQNGILMGQQDSPTLMVSLEELTGDESYYIYVTLAVGEEVQTFRANKSGTFSLTYNANDFIETDGEDLDKDVLESINFLLSQFNEHYEDDNE